MPTYETTERLIGNEPEGDGWEPLNAVRGEYQMRTSRGEKMRQSVIWGNDPQPKAEATAIVWVREVSDD